MSEPREFEETHETDAYEDLVAECIELMDARGSTAVEDCLKEHPKEADRVRAALKRLQSSGLLAPDGDSTAAEENDGVPSRLGEFEILHRIGGGGMGVVFLARQVSLDREVALKVIRQDYLFFENARKRFQREVTAVSRLQHPGIVPVTHVGEDEGIPYFAMDYVKGCSLGDLLLRAEERKSETGRPIDSRGSTMRDLVRGDQPIDASSEGSRLYDGTWEQVCLRIALRIAEALSHAHDHGIVHRDVKPSNVMITGDGQVKLVDFGLASLEADEKLTKSNAVLGSLLYMSPEQVRQEVVDERTDVYSLGVTLYEILCLSMPFDATDTALRDSILQGASVPLRRRNQAITRDTETVCGAAMYPVRERRYQSMRAFAEDLRNLLEHRPVQASPPGIARRTTRWVQRNPMLSMTMLLLWVVAVSSSGLWWQQRTANTALSLEKLKSETSLKESIEANENLVAATALARKNLEAARQAIDSMLTRIADVNLAVMPGAGPMRKRVLDTALALYGELVESGADQVSLQEDLSDLECRIAEIQYGSGQFEFAEKMLAKAVDRLRDLAGREPGLRSEFHLGRALTARSGLRANQRRFEESMADAREAVSLMEPALDGGVPGREEVVVLEKVAQAYNQLEIVGRRAPKRVGTEAPWTRDFGQLTVDVRERIVRDRPERQLAQHHLGLAYWRLGSRLIRQRKLAEAITKLQRAIEVLEPVAADNLASAVTRSYYAGSLGALARALHAVKRGADARVHREKQIEMLRELARRYPDYIGFASRLGGALDEFASREFAKGSVKAADDLITEALVVQRRTHSVVPGNLQYRGLLRSHLLIRCRLDFRMRQADGILGAAREFPDLDPMPGRGHLDAAVWILHAAIVLASDGERVEACRKEAVDHLRAASSTKFWRPDYLKVDIFRALKGRPRFEELRE